jgi:beta-lactamase regulating signal transducer with metallopeptidase domain
MTDLPLVFIWGLKAAPLLLAGWVATALLRRSSAATRHFVWVLAISGSLLLPAVTTVMPRWEVEWVAGLGTVERQTGDQGRSGATRGDRIPLQPATAQITAAARVVPPEMVGDDVAPPVLAPDRLGSPLIALVVWATGTSLVLLVIALALWRTHLLARRAAPMTDPGILAEVERIARRLGLTRPVTVLRAPDDAMPMTWGARRPHVLLPAGFPDWATRRRQAVLVHELAHVKRLDWLTQLVARLACALYWWNPLAWVAARRLREERELACDDLVLAHGTVPSSYAGDLLEIARAFRASPATALAGVAMARRSQLAGRLLAVLDASRVRGSVGSRQAVTAVTAVAAILMPLAALTAGGASPAEPAKPTSPSSALVGAPPVQSAVPVPTASSPVVQQQKQAATLCDWAVRGGRRSSSSTNIDDDRMTIKIVRDDCSLSVDSDGEITFSGDDRDVAGISNGGYFEIEEREGRNRRRVEITPEDGALRRRWLVDGDERPYGDEARAWLADMVLVLMRRAGLNAEARALRIFQQEGADGLAAEIEQLQSDYVASQYYRVLFDRAQLTPAQQTRLINGAAARITSDYELGRVLKTLATRGPLDASVQRSYVQAAEGLESDYEHRQALEALVRSSELDVTAMDAMLTSAERLNSDYERAELLTAMAARYPAGRPMPGSYLAAVSGMASDHERGRVLDPLLARDRLSSADRARVLGVVASMKSDYQRAEVLLGVVETGSIDDVTRAPFFAAVDRMSSDHERQRVLAAVVAGGPDEATTLAVIASAADIRSDYSKAEVLVAVARRGLETDRVRQAWGTAVESIRSSYERDRAREASRLRGT